MNVLDQQPVMFIAKRLVVIAMNAKIVQKAYLDTFIFAVIAWVNGLKLMDNLKNRIDNGFQ